MSGITPEDVQDKLTTRNLLWHLNRYDRYDPTTTAPFSANTPFLSTTAGTVERDVRASQNVSFPPLLTAIRFATDDYSREGYVFYAYAYALGKRAIPLREFAEEVRDVHVYTGFLPFHAEGELVVKIHLPSIRIERVEKYCASGNLMWTERNARYEAPEQFANIRELL